MYECAPRPVVRDYWIPAGHVGIEWTVDHMRRLARDGARAELVREAAAELVDGAEGREAAERIRAYLAESMVFKFDPPGVELIRTPELLVRQIECHGYAVGDCDDVATLGAALGLAVGLVPTYVLVGFSDSAPFAHVYTELATEAGAVELDTTRPAQFPPGLEIRRIERRGVSMYGPNGLGLVPSGWEPSDVVAESTTSRSWWEEPLGEIASVGVEWVRGQVGQSTDPYGPGTPQWGSPHYVPPSPYYGDPFTYRAEPEVSPVVGGLLLGGAALLGLKLAKVI